MHISRTVSRHLLVLLGSLLAVSVEAAPPAGTQIGNQASASYTDASGTPQTATSNLVLTEVLPVYGVDTEQSLNQTAVPASTSAFPFSITNQGNDTDSFLLAISDDGGGFTCASVAIYADANGDGIPDDGVDLDGTTVGPLVAGAADTFVGVCQVPGTTTPGQVNTVTVTATSVGDGTQSDSVSDTTTITGNAVVNVTKAMSASSGSAGSGPYTLTLTYTNNGNTTATGVVLTDLLDAGFEYVAGSGRWSDAPAIVLTDLDAADLQGTLPDQIVYDFDVTTADTITAVISQVVPGQSGTLSFDVNVAATATPGGIPNTARIAYDDGTGSVGPFDSNTILFTLVPTPGVTLTGPPALASATPGSTLSFTNTVTNTGNGADVFDVEVDPAGTNTYPAGTGFFLYQSDGVTPLLDSGGNAALPDTGTLAPGATYDVVLKVVLPNGTTGGGPYDVDKVATSAVDPSVDDTATDTLTTIVAATVDVTNNADLGGGGTGAGTGPEAAPVETSNADPGNTVDFTLFVNNTSAGPDTYDLAAPVLPAGWTVVFRNTSDTIVTNTGPVPGGGSVEITAEVTVPAAAAATDLGAPTPYESIHFRASSPTSSAVDLKHDAVVVNTIREIEVTPSNTGQVFPGGSVVYGHALVNNGNVTEASGSIDLSSADSEPSWGSQVFIDVNGDGLLDAGDTPVTAPGDLPALPPGGSVDILVRVNAPPGAPVASVNTTTLTADASAAPLINGVGPPAVATATDTTSVASGNLTLLKEQALDAGCDGTADGPYATTAISAEPNQCVRYRITATNAGTLDITQLVVNDATPANTTQASLVSLVPAASGNVTEPGLGATGTVSVDFGAVGPLLPAASVVLEFGVRIDP
jgi:uncharacterized repeat protein (TIGR01451 family)